MTRTFKLGSRDLIAREIYLRRLARIANRERQRNIDGYVRVNLETGDLVRTFDPPISWPDLQRTR